jgi:hypothetical protein
MLIYNFPGSRAGQELVSFSPKKSLQAFQNAMQFSLRTVLPNSDYLRDKNGDIINYAGPNSYSGILLKVIGQVNLWCWPVGSSELWSVINNNDLPAEARAAAAPCSNQDNPAGFWMPLI